MYSTFLKGDNTTQGANSKLTQGQSIAVDAQGNAYVTGNTNVKDFPTTANAFQPSLNIEFEPAQDAFVAKLNPSGSALIYSTYLGSGSNIDLGTDIKVDTTGNAYVTGITFNGFISITRPRNSLFPQTLGAFQTTDTYGNGRTFLTKFAPSGQALVYSTLVGTTLGSFDFPRLAIDRTGNAYLAASTRSSTYPTTSGSYKPVLNASDANGYVTKLNATGSALIYSTYFGGSVNEGVRGIGLDEQGNVMITGVTDSPDFPQTGTPEAFTQGTGFVTKLNATGTGLVYSRFLFLGFPSRLIADTVGSVYVMGSPDSGFQPTASAYQTVGSPYVGGGTGEGNASPAISGSTSMIGRENQTVIARKPRINFSFLHDKNPGGLVVRVIM